MGSWLGADRDFEPSRGSSGLQQSNENERLFVVFGHFDGMAACDWARRRGMTPARRLAEVRAVVASVSAPGDFQKMQGRALANALRVALDRTRDGPGTIAGEAAQMPRCTAGLDENAGRDHGGAEQNIRGRVEAGMDERAGHGFTPYESPSAGACKAAAAKAVANLILGEVQEADRSASGVFGPGLVSGLVSGRVLGGGDRGVLPSCLLRNGAVHSLGASSRRIAFSGRVSANWAWSHVESSKVHGFSPQMGSDPALSSRTTLPPYRPTFAATQYRSATTCAKLKLYGSFAKKTAVSFR
jgi:hypothetical protein